ncbi:MAG: TadE/TadG family type IV pilus assembly protein [Candidatus Binatia bacterium]
MKNSRGQSMVELGLMLPFILVLVGSVVDFGLAIFIGQVAEFASRDAARLGATLPPEDPDATVKVYPSDELGSCAASSCAGSGSQILEVAGSRIPGVGLFDAFNVTAVEGDVGGEESVTVTVSGTYQWAFLWMVRVVTFPLLGDAGFPENLTIARSTSARWEWQ